MCKVSFELGALYAPSSNDTIHTPATRKLCASSVRRWNQAGASLSRLLAMSREELCSPEQEIVYLYQRS